MFQSPSVFPFKESSNFLPKNMCQLLACKRILTRDIIYRDKVLEEMGDILLSSYILHSIDIFVRWEVHTSRVAGPGQFHFSSEGFAWLPFFLTSTVQSGVIILEYVNSVFRVPRSRPFTHAKCVCRSSIVSGCGPRWRLELLRQVGSVVRGTNCIFRKDTF